MLAILTFILCLSAPVCESNEQCDTGSVQCHTDYSSMLQTPMTTSRQEALLQVGHDAHDVRSVGWSRQDIIQATTQAMQDDDMPMSQASKGISRDLTDGSHKDLSPKLKLYGAGPGVTLDSHIHSKSPTQDQVTTTPSPEDMVNEPDQARPLYINILLFFAISFGILIAMLVFVSALELVVRWQRLLREDLLEQTAARLSTFASSKSSPQHAQRRIAIEAAELAQTFGQEEIALHLNGDPDRLDLLLRIAQAADPKTAADVIVQKGAKANKLNLSDRSLSLASNELQAVAKTLYEVHKKRDHTLAPRARLQKVFHEVRYAIRFARAAGKITKERWEDTHVDWTLDTKARDGLARKYADGHRDSVMVDKSTSSLTGLAFFTREGWIDHAAILFVILYSQVCALCYAMYLKWRFPLMFQFMGPWLLVSRGEAMAIILLTVFMILLMSRRFITGVRPYCTWSSVLETVVDKHVLVHRYIGATLVICAAVHILGHVKGSIPAIIHEVDNAAINKAFTYGTKIKFNINSWGEALWCYPAVTGYVLIGILCLFWATSNYRCRRWSFELFHYVHLTLIVLWCAALSMHGARQWLGVGYPLGVIGVAPVVLYYVLERISDIHQAKDPTIRLANAILKKKTVLLEIDIGNSDMQYETGMYCMLNVPSISQFQWHPFTIASAGGQQTFQVLFAVVGDWTTQLKDMIHDAHELHGPYPEINVRGGYGAPAERMKDKRHIVMVGAGVGATPFLSFLSNITSHAKARKPSQFDGLETAVFYWVSREPEDFVWANHYSSVIREIPHLKDRVSLRLCLSSKLETVATKEASATDIALFWLAIQVALSKPEASDLAHELSAPTQFGRPNWERELSKCALDAQERSWSTSGLKQEEMEMSVFVCGNPMLVEAIEEACDTLSTEQVTFRLFAEEF